MPLLALAVSYPLLLEQPQLGLNLGKMLYPHRATIVPELELREPVVERRGGLILEKGVGPAWVVMVGVIIQGLVAVAAVRLVGMVMLEIILGVLAGIMDSMPQMVMAAF